MNVIKQESCFGRCLNWVTKKLDICILKPFKTAMINVWNFLKTKTIEACTCCASDNDESDRYVINSFFLSKNKLSIKVKRAADSIFTQNNCGH